METFRVNVVGNIHLFNLFMPMVLKGKVKKVITLSSGHGDIDLINKYDLTVLAPYSVSKAAMNLAVAKFKAEYNKQGTLFMSISPGVIDTGNLSRERKTQTAALLSQSKS